MKLLWRISKGAGKYIWLYIVAILSTLLLTVISLFTPKILSDMISLVEGGLKESDLNTIKIFTIILIALYVLKVLFRYLSNYLAHVSAWNLVRNMRIKVYNHIQSFSMSFFHNKQTGDLMSRVVNDTAVLEMLYAHIIPDLITGLATIVGVMIVLLTINTKLALLTCIPIPLILIMGWIFVKKIRPKFKISQKAVADINSKLQDNFSGIKEIQSFGQEEKESKEVEERCNYHIKSLLHALNLSSIFHPTVEFLTSLGNVLVVGVGGLLAFNGSISVADIVAFLLYLSLFYTPVASFARILEDAQQAYAGSERIVEILDTVPDVMDTKDAIDIGTVKGDIIFENVSFSYEEGQKVLEDISFSCEAGQMIALVGPTGVGKTTLTQLISRFYEPVKGRILIDGHDIKDVTLESLRRNIAPVLQDTFLFYGSIYDNISYANPSATREEIIEAAKAARIHDDIIAMADGYETMVGERGVRLSGGQKQRMAIARAILRNAPIIILDEATASVDTHTEIEIQQAIAELAESRTIIAIAHRLSTIQNADKIIVLNDGRITEEGTHQELLKKNGLYKKLNDINDRKNEN